MAERDEQRGGKREIEKLQNVNVEIAILRMLCDDFSLYIFPSEIYMHIILILQKHAGA